MDRSEIEVVVLSVVVIPILGWLHSQLTKLWIAEQKIEGNNAILQARIEDLQKRVDRQDDLINKLRGG